MIVIVYRYTVYSHARLILIILIINKLAVHVKVDSIAHDCACLCVCVLKAVSVQIQDSLMLWVLAVVSHTTSMVFSSLPSSHIAQ